jgi:hypothetical protein
MSVCVQWPVRRLSILREHILADGPEFIREDTKVLVPFLGQDISGVTLFRRTPLKLLPKRYDRRLHRNDTPAEVFQSLQCFGVQMRQILPSSSAKTGSDSSVIQQSVK